MRRALGAVLAAAVVAGVLLFVQRPGPVDAQGGGTVEVTVTYNGAPVVEKLKVNKDTEKCGTEAVIEKVVASAGRTVGVITSAARPPYASGWKPLMKSHTGNPTSKKIPGIES